MELTSGRPMVAAQLRYYGPQALARDFRPHGVRRWSCTTIDQNIKTGDDSESIKNQITLITEYAEKQGVNICETYIDDDISGTTSERPNLERMINDIIWVFNSNYLTLDDSDIGFPP